jgi:hypothetical protein
LHFVNAQSVVRFYGRSRSFDRMQHFIGGDPYFYFTVLAAAYNEYHTNRAADALPEFKPGRLIGASPIETTTAEVIGRYEIFVKNLRPMIPNLFRYKTEAALFEDILERRGVTHRCDTIEKELKRYETIAHDFEGVNLQRSNLLISYFLFVLALWGVFGALATAASVFVALHSDAQVERVREPVLDFAKSSAEWLIEIAFWAASVGLALAAVLTVAILFRASPLFFRRLGVSRLKRNLKTPEVT